MQILKKICNKVRVKVVIDSQKPSDEINHIAVGTAAVTLENSGRPEVKRWRFVAMKGAMHNNCSCFAFAPLGKT